MAAGSGKPETDLLPEDLGASVGGAPRLDPEEAVAEPPFELVEHDEAWSGRELLLLLGLTAVAAALRLLGLSAWSMWVDEAHTLRDATTTWDAFWATNLRYYPLGSLTLRAVLEHLPDFTEGWLRLPFAFAGILTVPLLAIVGRAIVGRRAAWVAALLLAFDPWHLYWSQNVRGYSVMLLLATAGVGLFWAAVQRRSCVLYAFGVLSAVAAGLTHPSAYSVLVVFAIVAFVLLWTRPGIYRTGLVVWTTVIVVGLVFGVFAFAEPVVTWVRDAKPTGLWLGHLVRTSAFFFGVSLSAVAVLSAVILRRDSERGSVVFCSLWAFVPLGLVAVASVLTKTTAQYAFVGLPGFCLLAGALCAAIGERVARAGGRRLLEVALPLALLTPMIAGDVLYFTTRHGERPRWREAAAALADPTVDHTLVLTTNEPSLRYYLQPETYSDSVPATFRYDIRSIEAWDIEAAGGGRAFLESARREAEERGARLFVVVSYPELEEKDPERVCRQWLWDHARLWRRLPAWVGPKDMTVHVWALTGE